MSVLREELRGINLRKLTVPELFKILESKELRKYYGIEEKNSLLNYDIIKEIQHYYIREKKITIPVSLILEVIIHYYREYFQRGIPLPRDIYEEIPELFKLAHRDIDEFYQKIGPKLF